MDEPINQLLERARHDIDCRTVDLPQLTRTEIATLAVSRELTGQADGIELANTLNTETREHVVHALRLVADRLLGD